MKSTVMAFTSWLIMMVVIALFLVLVIGIHIMCFRGLMIFLEKNFANRVSKIALIFKKSILIIVFNSIIGNYDVGYPTKIVCLNCLFRFISRFAGSTPAVVIGVMPK